MVYQLTVTTMIRRKYCMMYTLDVLGQQVILFLVALEKEKRTSSRKCGCTFMFAIRRQVRKKNQWKIVHVRGKTQHDCPVLEDIQSLSDDLENFRKHMCDTGGAFYTNHMILTNLKGINSTIKTLKLLKRI
jgi:hypothetical protein